MSTIMCKASKDQDLYFEWDTSTDSPVFAGDREEAAAWLMDYYSPHAHRLQTTEVLEQQVERDLARVDETGCAAKYAGSKFDFDESHVYLWGRFEVPRDQVYDLVMAYRISWALGLKDPTEEALQALGVIHPLELT